MSYSNRFIQWTFLPAMKCFLRSQMKLTPEQVQYRLSLLRKAENSNLLRNLESYNLPFSRAIIERDQLEPRSEWVTYKRCPVEPDPPRSGVLYFHGGGFLVGIPSIARPITVALSESVTHVFAPYYRKPPEEPFPGALEDAVNAYARLHEKLGGDPAERKIILAGDSAGGGLALSTFLCLKKDQRFHQLPLPAGLVLFSPWLDLSGNITRDQADHDDSDPLLPLECIPLAGGMYSKGNLAEHDHENYAIDPILSPLHSPHSRELLEDLPPTLIQYGEHEALSAESKELAQLAKKNVVLDEIPDGWHSCHYLGRMLPESNQALTRANHFITKLLHD